MVVVVGVVVVTGAAVVVVLDALSLELHPASTSATVPATTTRMR
jgi:hypothetical protein